MSDMKLYKVLRVKLKPDDGTFRVEPTMMTTNYREYLPKQAGKPGRWTREIEGPQLCTTGWHLTNNPTDYIREDRLNCMHPEFSVVFEAEGRTPGPLNFARLGNRDKGVYGQIRLIREVHRRNWPASWLAKIVAA